MSMSYLPQSTYISTASAETLNAFEEAKIIKNNFFRKRIEKKSNRAGKFISFSKLTDNFDKTLLN